MAKEKSNNIIWIIAVIAIAVIFLGPKFGLFSSSELPVPENEDPTYQVVLSILPATICPGDVITGSISANIPNAVCKVYTKMGGLAYQLTDTVTLNSQGVFSKSTQVPELPGNMYSYAVCCDSENHCKNSNEAKLVINTCSQENPQTCTETDGGLKEFLAGSVSFQGVQDNDNCKTANTVNEYYCDDLGQKALAVLPCANGCTGGACNTQPIVCSNTDSGLSYPFNLQTIGSCTDSNGYIEDSCDGAMLKEYYCEPGMNGGAAMCGYTSYNCDGVIPGTTCQNGRCV